MFRPVQVYIGLRYTRAKRRNHFISFISLTSMAGVALGVTALITVLSVMNGFEKELRERILGMTAHATVVANNGALLEWPAVLERLLGQPQITGAAPFIRAQGMLTHQGLVQGSLVRGVLPAQEPKVSVVAEKMIEGRLDDLQAGSWRVILGSELARALRAQLGDRITIVAPQPSVSPAGIIPRLKRFTVVGIFRIGMHEYDSALAIVHMDDAARLFRFDDAVTGIRLQTDDVFAAPMLRYELDLPGGYAIIDWTQYHVNFFRALRTEKITMFIILTLIVAVAAFNIVSTLVMIVTDKQSEIAILRTLGMTPRSVMAVFVVQGTIIGMIGVLLGIVGGVWLAANVETFVPAIEQLLGMKFLPSDVYYISDLPSDMRWSDVARIGAVAFGLCVGATLYPAWQASRTQPVEALRYE